MDVSVDQRQRRSRDRGRGRSDPGAPPPRVYRWLSRRRALPILLVLAAALRLTNLVEISRMPVAEYQFTWQASDTAAYQAWAERILAGDVLGRDAPHPFPPWMQATAPREVWERWWGGKAVLHNVPLFPYMLALVRGAFGGGFWPIALAQLALGLTGVALVYLLAHRFFGPRAAVASGALWALYGPALLYEALALRDTLGVAAALAAVYAISTCESSSSWRWFRAGVALAIAVLARESALSFAPVAAAWALWKGGGPPWRRVRALALVAAGASTGLAPLVARNVAVEVSPFAMSAIGGFGIVYGHVVDTSPALFMPTPTAMDVWVRADGRLSAALPLIWQSYAGSLARLLANETQRLLAVFSSFEAWDNVNWYYFRDRGLVLGTALPFEVLLALGALGLWAAGRAFDRQALLLGFLGSSAAGLMVTAVVGRYRLPLAAALAVYAGAGVVWLVQSLRRGRLARFVLGVATVGAVVWASRQALRDLEEHMRYRPAEFGLAAVQYLQRGRPDLALEEARAGLRAAYRGSDQRALPEGYSKLVLVLANESHKVGRAREAAAELEAALRSYPDDPDLHEVLRFLYEFKLDDPARAAQHAAAVARLRPR